MRWVRACTPGTWSLVFRAPARIGGASAMCSNERAARRAVSRTASIEAASNRNRHVSSAGTKIARSKRTEVPSAVSSAVARSARSRACPTAQRWCEGHTALRGTRSCPRRYGPIAELRNCRNPQSLGRYDPRVSSPGCLPPQVSRKLSARPDPELRVRVREVELDRLDADDHLLGDLLVREPSCRELGHASLCGSQPSLRRRAGAPRPGRAPNEPRRPSRASPARRTPRRRSRASRVPHPTS